MVYVVRVGGDYLHARLLLPGLTAVLAPVAVVPATRAFRAARAGPSVGPGGGVVHPG